MRFAQEVGVLLPRVTLAGFGPRASDGTGNTAGARIQQTMAVRGCLQSIRRLPTQLRRCEAIRAGVWWEWSKRRKRDSTKTRAQSFGGQTLRLAARRNDGWIHVEAFRTVYCPPWRVTPADYTR
ncbi:hypothetical protein MTO96_013662 [Rhipicephalus appendiculatus]